MRNSLFIVFIPVIFWVAIVSIIVSVSKSGRRVQRPTQMRTTRNTSTQRYVGGGSSFSKPKPTIKTNSERPKMKEGLFDMSLGKVDDKKKKSSIGKSFRNTDFDVYEAKGRLKDLVSGYDKELKTSKVKMKRASHMQYSHTYDGHEPWDDCLPKEKDPWDPDFYA